MPKKKSNKKANRKVPPWGRSESEVHTDLGHQMSSDVPLGNTDPTVVQGKLYGDMPNASRKATGRLKPWKGKYT